jgi:ubiquinone/menaquinone biosynthesis C-methylase UbiE
MELTLFPDFSERCNQPEIMDGVDYSSEEFLGSLADLRRVNQYLGGTRALTRHLFPMIESLRKSHIRILDVGTGSADIPVAIVEWARQKNLQIDFTVLDLNHLAVKDALQQTADYPEIQVVCADAMHLPFDNQSFDFAITSLFLHHLSTAQAAEVISDLTRVTRIAWIINDLHRHPVAYYAIRLLTSLFTSNRLVRHDAAVSVLRGFTRNEFLRILAEAKMQARIFRHFPYRFVVISEKYPSTL